MDYIMNKSSNAQDKDSVMVLKESQGPPHESYTALQARLLICSGFHENATLQKFISSAYEQAIYDKEDQSILLL